MKMLVGVMVAFVAVAWGQELDEGCSALTRCMESVQAEYDRCTEMAQDIDMDFLDAIIPEHKREKLACMKEVKEARDTKSALNREREAEYRKCLADRAQFVEAVRGKKANQCQGALENFNSETQRTKSAATREERRQRRRERNQALDEAGITLQMWRDMKQKRRAFKTCKRGANKLKKSCKPLTKCCSEAQICHLDYELSNTHDGIKGANRKIILQKRKCAKGQANFADIAEEEVSGDEILGNMLPGGDS